jgi:hypothetical protein
MSLRRIVSLIAMVAAGGLVFNLLVLGRPPTDSGFGLLSERQGNAFRAVLTGLFGGLLIFLARRGLSTRVMPTLWNDPDLIFAQPPLAFLLAYAIWAGGGVRWSGWRGRSGPGGRQGPELSA